MRLRISIAALLVMSLQVACSTETAETAPLPGVWLGEGLQVRLEPRSGGAYGGSIQLGNKQYPMTARINTGGALEGSFTADGSQFQFTADLSGDTLTFRTGSATYRLSRQGGANPLEQTTQASSPPRAAPAGYKLREDPQGGTILVGNRARGTSGPDIVRNAMADMKTLFDSPPQLTTGFTDTRTGQTQGMFVSKTRDKLINGIVVGNPQGDGARVGIVYDNAGQFAKSRPRLMKQLLDEIPAMNAGPAAVGELRDTRLPDGSGNIKLPPGWNITSANKGTVEAHGPNGEAIVLGVALPVAAPSGFNNAPFVLAYMAPERAIVAITPSLNFAAQQTGGPMHDNIRVLESHRTEYPGGQAAFMVWQGDEMLGGRRTAQTAFGLVITAPVGPGAWMLYISGVVAPVERFAETFPSMLQSWQSWKISDRVFTERLQKTAETMRATTEILQGINKNDQRAFDKANQAWDDYFGGTATVMDARTGRPVQMSVAGNRPLDQNGNPDPNAPAQNLNSWVEEQNRLAGGNRFQILNPGQKGEW